MKNLRGISVAALTAAVLASTALSGPALAKPDNGEPASTPSPAPSATSSDSITVPEPGPGKSTDGPLTRSGSKVKVPNVSGCTVPKKLIANGQQGVPFEPYKPGAMNEARPKRMVHFHVMSPYETNHLLAATAATSWYDRKGQLQVRVLVLPVKHEHLTQTHLQVSVFDSAPQAGGKATRKVHKIDLNGKATCIRETVPNPNQDGPVVAYGWGDNFANPDSQRVPLPDTARVLQGRKYLYADETLSVSKPDELARLAAAALNGKVATGPVLAHSDYTI